MGRRCKKGKEMPTDKLSELVKAGPDPTRGLQHLVLSRFLDIKHARAHLRGWVEITTAMGLPETRHKSVAAAFYRVRRKVASGVLEPPQATTPTARQGLAVKTAAAPMAAPKDGPADIPTSSEESRPQRRAGFEYIDINK
jgi:hypothetical protein